MKLEIRLVLLERLSDYLLHVHDADVIFGFADNHHLKQMRKAIIVYEVINDRIREIGYYSWLTLFTSYGYDTFTKIPFLVICDSTVEKVLILFILLIYISKHPLAYFWDRTCLNLFLDHDARSVEQMVLYLLPQLLIELHQITAL